MRGVPPTVSAGPSFNAVAKTYRILDIAPHNEGPHGDAPLNATVSVHTSCRRRNNGDAHAVCRRARRGLHRSVEGSSEDSKPWGPSRVSLTDGRVRFM